jgi:putative membrane-bound dehydrogenase-like protein
LKTCIPIASLPAVSRAGWVFVGGLIAWTAQSAHFDFTGQTLTVPDGFEVDLVAGPPLVARPIAVDFDELGRLYVAESSGSNDKVEIQLEQRPHHILRLQDTNGDGRFDRSTVFADRMMLPQGALWHDGSLYVAAPPSIWKLTDTDDDGIADRREEWHLGRTLTGCANDLHGPYLGLDGYIYWCKGAFAEQTYQLDSGATFRSRAAHVFRKRPDGSGLEAVMTGGMDNPVDLIFTANGERILTSTFFQHPGGGHRDGLIHAIYGGVYGKPHDVLDDHKRTGDLMPILTHLGPAAPAGLARYQSDSFGEDYRGNLFAALFNLHKVTRHQLEPVGATFQSRDSDFLVSDSVDFHPTDVIEDADGSLLVIDTGGWYKLCCPTSQLWKPDVLGAIYRIRHLQRRDVADPRGLRLDWNQLTPNQLADLLHDARPAVHQRAVEHLSRIGNDAVPLLRQRITDKQNVTPNFSRPQSRRNAIWTLTRIDSLAARAAIREALADPDETVRQVALHSISLWRDGRASDQLLEILQTGSPHNRRVAAEAIGRIFGRWQSDRGISADEATAALLNAAAMADDRTLDHALIYALIEIGLADTTAAGLHARHPRTRRASLIALDQMENGGLLEEQVLPLATSTDPILKATAWWILGHRPAWAASLAQQLHDSNGNVALNQSEETELERLLAQNARRHEGQQLLTALLRDDSIGRDRRRLALRAMARSNLKTAPDDWTDVLLQILAKHDDPQLPDAIATVGQLAVSTNLAPDLSLTLVALAKQTALPDALRIEALAALPLATTRVDSDLFDLLCAHLDSSLPVPVRNAAVAGITRARLTDDQLRSLANSLRDVGPLELTRLLPAFEQTSSEDVGLALVAALREADGSSALRHDVLRSLTARFTEQVRTEAESLISSLDVDAEKQSARLNELLASLKDGDIRRGQSIFNSEKAACASCHAIGYLGGDLGPDLTRIGQVRTERDLLEAILYPSMSFVRSYEPVVVVTRDGELHSGVLRNDASDEVVLGTGAGVELRIARQDVVDVYPDTISLMPGGLDEQLTAQELADLLAFLKATQW